MCTIHILQRRHEGADASNDGGVAQLGERCVRNAEVGSSILLLSTTRISTGRFRGTFRFCRYAVLKLTYLLFLNATDNNFEDSLVK